jgi:arsenite-transporting ATPase
MPHSLTELTRDTLELKAENMIGVAALRGLFMSGANEPAFLRDAGTTPPGATLAGLIADLATGDHGLVMCMGKGGVGKTTVAAAIAVALARRGHQVQLTTTDPAAHLSDTLPDAVPGLQVSRIDPVEATRAYREQVMSTKGKNLDAAGRAALAEDLLSPCTEEVAVFRQFAHAVNESRRKFVVIDTAPTGHTLLLLDAAGSYHRDVVRQLGDKVSFTTPLMNLQDPARTKIIIVTLPEPTPVLEARALQDDLQRAGIHPWAWVINNSLAAAAPTGDFLRRRAAGEAAQIAEVRALADRVAIVPLLTSEPIGEERLADLIASVAQPV